MNFAYHRLDRSWPKYRWWKPLVTGLIAAGFLLVFTLLIVVPLIVASLVIPDGIGADLETLFSKGVVDTTVPVILVVTLASIALMLPAIILARLIMGPRPLGLLSSVAGRLRWGWMLGLLLPALVALGASAVLYLLVLPPLLGDPVPAPAVGPDTWLMLAIIVLLVPLQATAEEYVFRGYLMQSIGGWLKHPAFAILIPVPLFMVGHTQYDIWGAVDVGVFAVFAGWLTWRTGGLEAAIVAHVINNGAIFTLGAFDLVDTNQTEGSPLGILVTAMTLALYSWLVVRLMRKRKLETERTIVEIPPPPAALIVDSHS